MKHLYKNITTFRLLLWAFFQCLTPFLFSQGYNVRFEHLTIEDGLADNYVHDIFMDSKGYMWFATQDGLSRYDGYSFKNFRQVLGDSASLNFQIAMSIAEDKDGTLWIATLGGGLNKFDPVTETFESYILPVPENSINTGKPFSKVIIDGEGEIWGGTYDNGMFYFDKKNEELKNFYLNDNFKNGQQAFRLNSVIDMIQDIGDPNILWIAGNNGLYRYDKTTYKIDRIPFFVHNKLDTVSSFRALFMEKPGELWIGTWTQGLVRYDIARKKWDFFPHNIPEWEKENVSANIVFDIEKKSNSEFWLATKDEGLLSFDTISKKFTYYKHDPFNGRSISSDDTEVVYRDRDGRIWISNFYKGISFIDPSSQMYHFSSMLPPAECPSTKVFEAYSAALDLARDKLYVTTVGCGALLVFDKKPDNNPVFLYSVFISPDLNGQLNVFVDSKKRIWVAGVYPSYESPYSLFFFDPDTRQLIPFEHPMLSEVPVHQYFINEIMEDNDFNIWLATSYGGLIKLNEKNNSLTQYVQSPEHPEYPASHIRLVEINNDSKGNIWMSAMEDGLFKFDPKTESIAHFKTFSIGGKSLNNERIMCTEEDANGMIWVGVEWDGIWVLDPSLPVDQDMKHFGTESGLPGSKVAKIVKDANKSLWFRTSQGTCRYDEESQKFVILGEKEGNYYSSLGFEGMELLKSGDIFIGSKNGFYTFNPSKGHKNTTPPPVVFSGFMVNNEPYELEKSLNYTEEITLDYQENYFSISFAALNYSQPERNRYAYVLDGYDKDWIYPAEGQNIATYTKVGEGTYTFRVKATNNDGVWNEEGISLKIKVLPPMHRRWWAFLFYGIVLIGGLLYIRRYQINRLMEKADNERLKELNSLKTKLYTNITHEFRTPLTVILGMAEQLSEEGKKSESDNGKFREKVQRHTQFILRNASNLLQLVNQMLDLSKLDSGKLTVNWELGDVVVFLQYLAESFHSYAVTKDIQLTFYPEVKSLEMDYDQEKIQHIISNLLSNAIKFTPEGGKVLFHVSEITGENGQNGNQSFLQIKISDTGIGIPEEHLPYIFTRFYQVNDTHTKSGDGTGIGLTLTKELIELMGGTIVARSRIGSGTEFTVRLPIHQTASSIYQKKEARQGMKLPVNNWALRSGDLTANHPDDELSEIELNEDVPLLLIIEDNPDVAIYIQECLEENGQYHILWAENGQRGIDLALKRVPDLIVSDVMMPEKDGFEVTQFLKNDERTSHIPIVLLTAKADFDSKIAGLEYGADAYLSKPFDKKELLVRVDKLVELRRRLQARYGGDAAFTIATPGQKVKQEQNVISEKGIQIEDAFLKKVNAAIEKHLSNADFEVAHLCRAVKLSQSQLYRKIKALTDKSIAAYIRSFRLHRGKELLQSSDLSISEVAYEVGFADPAYFSRTFSEEFGMSPNDLRK